MGLDAGAVANFSMNTKILSILSHSSTGAEIRAIDLLLREFLHIIDICTCIQLYYTDPVIVYCDNSWAITISKTLKNNHRIKHINMIINYIFFPVNIMFQTFISMGRNRVPRSGMII